MNTKGRFCCEILTRRLFIKFVSEVMSIIFIFLFLCSCEKNENNMNMFIDKDKKYSDELIENIVETIKKKDSDKMKDMFSLTAKKKAVNFEKQVDCFFENFNDSNLRIEDNAGPITYDDTENGLKSKKIINWYEVHGGKNNYKIFFVAWIENTFDKENVGLYALRVVEEEDYDKQFIEYNKMEIAGIYYNPTDK